MSGACFFRCCWTHAHTDICMCVACVRGGGGGGGKYLGVCVLKCTEFRSCVKVDSRWLSWVFRPNESYGFRECKAILNHASALVTICP